MNPGKKLRILCLHGYHGSADVLRLQFDSLSSAFGPSIELVFVNAPSLTTGDFGWWHSVSNPQSTTRGNPGVASNGSVYYKGWEQTRAFLVDLFARQGPFDGIFGFSQGAALAGLMVGMRAPDGKPTQEKPLVFDFAIMVGGFTSPDPALARLYSDRASYNLPSVHIIGRSDGIVPNSRSFDLASKFKSPVILEHSGGHVIASTSSVRKGVMDFLEQQRKRLSQRQTDRNGLLVVPLWPGLSTPVMRVYFPTSTRTMKPAAAIIIFRGGAYTTSMGSGAGTAQWAAANGFIGIEVDYRTQSTHSSYPAGYADAARAVRLARANASAWNLDPGRVVLLGYSAGGHLASLLSTQPDLYRDPNDDLASSISAHADLVVLGYPLISFIDGYRPGAYLGSTENFFGRPNICEAERKAFSNELHVTAQHPPTFLWVCSDDTLVPPNHSRLFAESCRRMNVPVTFYEYSKGGHGAGLALNRSDDLGKWTTLLLRWLDQHWGRM